MSAEVLRRAASLMRERAEAASTEHLTVHTLARSVVRCSCGASSVGNPYWANEHAASSSSWQVSDGDATQVWDERQRLVASAEGLDESLHIASWHPAVALAVADWLDSTSSFVEMYGEQGADTRGYSYLRSLAVARAYLGESS